MYSSLRRVDIVADVEGQRIAVQTDHRTAVEMEAEPELTALFALSRVLNAAAWLRSEGHAGQVRYTVTEDPPPILREALSAAGATLDVNGTESDLGPADPERASALADAAFSGLAAKVLARLQTSDLRDALSELEAATDGSSFEREADDAGFWTTVAELASLGGELARTRGGGRWVHNDQGTVPFGFQLERGPLLFPTNRAEKFLSDGSESVTALLAAMDDLLRDRTDLRILPSLRRRSQVPLDRIAWEALTEGDLDDLPIVVYGEDGEKTFALVEADALDRPLEEIAAEARRHIADEVVHVERVDVQGLVVLVVGGGYYASEKLLDVAFLASAHVRLGAELLVAAAPARGMLLLASATQAPEKVGLFALIAQRRFEDAAAGTAISPLVLLVHEGAVVGYAQPQEN